MPKLQLPRGNVPRGTARYLFWLFASAVALAITVWVTVNSIANYGRSVREAYLAEHTSLLIVRFMDANDDQLPRDWRDLETAYRGSTAETEGFSFEEMRDNVEVRFDNMILDAPSQKLFIRTHASLNSPNPNERVRNRIAQIADDGIGQE